MLLNRQNELFTTTSGQILLANKEHKSFHFAAFFSSFVHLFFTFTKVTFIAYMQNDDKNGKKIMIECREKSDEVKSALAPKINKAHAARNSTIVNAVKGNALNNFNLRNFLILSVMTEI